MSIFYSAILLNFKVMYLEVRSEAHPKLYNWEKYIPLIGILLLLGKTGVRKILDVVTDDWKSRNSCFRLSVIMSKC